ncbi:MAG: DUF2254 domain-containing protein [Marinovum algicola]|uniref:DUF2254 domain-containing protein n=1 Tax=Marinovum algicola TaxID=42444 RepID=UPI0032F07E7F
MNRSAIVSGTALKILRFARSLWIRVALISVLALIASGLAMAFEGLLPEALRQRFGTGAVMPVLKILASGMLAVSTFSLNVMVTAHHAAAAQATPRAHRILLNDTVTHTALATFIGAFVYSLSCIILVQAGLHPKESAVILMGVTVLVVVLVILAMLRWIDRLSDLGSMDATLRKTDEEARVSLMTTRHSPALTATPLTGETVIPPDAKPLPAPRSGYVQVLNLPHIDDCLPGKAARVWFTTAPGTFVLRGQTVGHVAGLDEARIEQVQEGLTIGEFRTFEQDATYGLLVLSEITSRALSPGINDPGTAIDVIARQERLLWEWGTTPRNDATPAYSRIFVTEVSPESLVEFAFAGVARDGAGHLEVQRRVLHALDALRDAGHERLADAARDWAKLTFDYGQSALVLEWERQRMQETYENAFGSSASP